jgi:hypothetical protein
MHRGRHPARRAIVTLMGALFLLTLALPACGGDEFTVPADLPSWPAGSSPSPAVYVPVGPGLNAEDSASDTGSWTDGWEFWPYVDIEVTALGYFDDNADGLVSSHRAGIFDTLSADGLAGTSIGPDSPLDGAYRWESLASPLVLKAGHSYVVAVSAKGPPWDLDTPSRPAGMVWSPWIKHGKYHANLKPWGFPEVDKGEMFVLTANFKFQPVSAASSTP